MDKWITILILSSLILLSGSKVPEIVEVPVEVIVRDTVVINEALYTLPDTVVFNHRISSTYKNRFHPVLKYWRFHYSIDIAMPTGTDITADGNGRIKSIEYRRGGYGTNVIVSYGMNTEGKEVTIRYSHLSKVLVKVGQMVKKNEVIALSGVSGLCSGAHLDYCYMEDTEKLDPLKNLHIIVLS